MRLHEAIEQAGEGGKIRRPTWNNDAYWLISDETIEYCKKDERPSTECVSELTADDWEVVTPEPVIEVNDVVHCNQCMEHDRCAVQEINNGKVILHRIERGHHINELCACDEEIETLTIIRKGGKKIVIEGVVIRDDHIADGEIRDGRIHDLDRGTYDLTLTERKEG